MKIFDKFIILSIFLLSAGFLSAQDCPDFTQNNLVRTTENCQSSIQECLPIDFEFSENYEFTLNGNLYSGTVSPCAVGNVAGYDVLGIGNYPVNIDLWEVDGTVHNNITADSPSELANIMTGLSNIGWSFDDSNFVIETTSPPDSLGWLVLTEINTGLTAEIIPQYNAGASNTAIEFPVGNHVLIAYNFIEDCADTLLIDVVCEQITDSLFFTIEIGESDNLVFDPTNLDPVDSFADECAAQSGTSVDFIVDPATYSMEYVGIGEGTEQACIIMCGVNGICDTTYVFVTVVNCTEPEINSVNVVDVNCDEPGSIQLVMEDPTQSYQFIWDNGTPDTDYATDLSAGIYNVTITYADSTQQSCFTTASYNVGFIDSLENYNYSIGSNCDNNGVVIFDNPGLTYTWDDGFQGQERFDVAAGVYSVTVSSNFCEEVTSVVMPETTIYTDASVSNVCDSLGSIYFEAVGGFPPYTYQWSDGVFTNNRPAVDVGIYTVTVTDAFGCTVENTYEIVDDCPSTGCTQPVIVNTEVIHPSCDEPGSIVIQLLDNTVPYDFDWSHNGMNSGVQIDLWAADFDVTITNTNPTTGEVCSTTAEFTLLDNDSLDYSVTSIMAATCGQSGAAAYSNNNLVYNWSDGGQGRIRNDLAAGDYTITISTPNGTCEEVTFLTIPEEESINLTATVNNVCDSLGAIYLMVTGNFSPFTYQWSNGTITRDQEDVDVGIYGVTITDSQGCTLSESFEIVDDCPGTGCEDPIIIATEIQNPDCDSPGSIFLEVENFNSNTTFTWSHNGDDSNIQTELPAGNYDVTITNFDPATGSSCFVTAGFDLVLQDSLGFFLVNSTPADCGPSGTAEYSDPTLIYNWSDGGQGHIRADLFPGVYMITVTSPTESCEEVTFLDIPEISTISYNPVVANVCDTLGSIYLFNPNGSYTYEWSNGTITPDQPAVDVGVYSVTVTNDQGCTVTEAFEIVDDCSGTGCEDPIIVASETQNPDCNNLGTILIEIGNFNPNMSYSWSHNGPNSNVQNNLPAGQYVVTISDINPNTGDSCFTIASFNLIAEDSLGFFLVNSSGGNCSMPGSAQYSDSTLIYNWSDGGLGHLRNDLSPGDYMITVTNGQGNCAEFTTLTIPDNGGGMDAEVIVSNVCDTLGSIYINVLGGAWPYTYDWADLSGSTDPEYREAIGVGNYIVTVTDAAGCQLMLNFDIVDDCPSTGDLTFTFVPEDVDILCGESAPIINPVAESECPGDIEYTFTETSVPNCGNTSIITREWVATDDCGNTASAQQTIFELDIEAPEITTVGDITVDLLNGDSLPNPFNLVMSEDDCSGLMDLNFTKEENITEDGYEVVYTWTAIDECGNLSTEFHTVDVTGGMIWPGDTDSNKVVNNFDVFNIGFAYGETGPARMMPTLDFLPQYAAPWSANGLDDVNFRHADTDGNGIVDEQDILAVNLNYDLVHNLQEAGDTRESFDIDFVYETVTADNWVHVAIMLGNTAEPIDDFYGAGFIIEYDQNMVVANTAHVDFSESWTGTFFDDFIALQKDFHEEGRLDVGLVRTNQQGIDGSGKIGSFRFQLPEGVEFSPFTLTAREGEGVRADKSPYELETVEVIVTNVKEFLPLSSIQIFPNPVKTELNLSIPTEFQVTEIQLFGTNGQMVEGYTNDARTLEVSTLPAGLYYLRVLTTEGTWTDKVSIMK